MLEWLVSIGKASEPREPEFSLSLNSLNNNEPMWDMADRHNMIPVSFQCGQSLSNKKILKIIFQFREGGTFRVLIRHCPVSVLMEAVV